MEALRSGSLRISQVDSIRLEVICHAVQSSLDIDVVSDIRSLLRRQGQASAQGQVARALRGAAQAGPYRLPLSVRSAVHTAEALLNRGAAGPEDGPNDRRENAVDDAETVGGRAVSIISVIATPDGSSFSAVVD